MIIKTNWKNDDLWCIYSKEKIQIGEKYVEAIETYGGEPIPKTYKIEHKDKVYDL